MGRLNPSPYGEELIKAMASRRQALSDDRGISFVSIETRAFSLLPQLGPIAWAVYSLLIYRAAQTPSRMPSSEDIARACGISEQDAATSLEDLIRHQLLERRAEPSGSDVDFTYRILPAPEAVEQYRPTEVEAADRDVLDAEWPPVPAPANGLALEDEAEQWKRRIEEKRLARQLFASFVGALGDGDEDLTDEERDRIRVASEIVGAAGATPKQVQAIAERIRALQPRAAVDPIWIAEHWVELTRDLFENDELD